MQLYKDICEPDCGPTNIERTWQEPFTAAEEKQVRSRPQLSPSIGSEAFTRNKGEILFDEFHGELDAPV